MIACENEGAHVPGRETRAWATAMPPSDLPGKETPSVRRVSMEDFRPARLQDILGQPDAIARLLRLARGVRNGSIVPPTLLLHGPPGIGKTTAVRAFAREVLSDEFENSFSELKAFDDRSPRRMAEIILNSRRPPLRGAPFRIIFFDEIETLSPESMNALRPAVEGEGGTSLYALACNDIRDVPKPLQSRCTVLEFRPVSPEGMRQILARALPRTSFRLDDLAIASIVERCHGIPREAIKLLLEEGGAA